MGLKLEQSAKEVAQRHQDAEAWKQANDGAIEQSSAEAQERAEAQPRPSRPPPWIDKIAQQRVNPRTRSTRSNPRTPSHVTFSRTCMYSFQCRT